MEIKQLKQIEAHMWVFAGKYVEWNTSPEKSEDFQCLQLSWPKNMTSFCYPMIQNKCTHSSIATC